jgi:hypothetical protein
MDNHFSVATLATLQALEGAGVDQPVMQLFAADTEGILHRLPRPCAVSVE